MRNDVTLRLAAETDLDGCIALAVQNDGGTYDEWRPRFEARLASADGAIFVAMTDDGVIGYGRVAHQQHGGIDAEPALSDGLYLSGVAVASDRRCEGIGTALCEARIEWARGRSDTLWFFTNMLNEASRALHRCAGFEELHEFSSPALDGGRGVLGRLDL